MSIELAPVTQVINDEKMIVGLHVEPRTRMPLGQTVGMRAACAIAQKVAPCMAPNEVGDAVPGTGLYVYDKHGNAVLTATIPVPSFGDIVLN